MATGNGTSTVVTPSSIHIDVNQFQKEPHHCKFENCQNHRRGYNDFCREHKAIGKVISGRIARQKRLIRLLEEIRATMLLMLSQVFYCQRRLPRKWVALLEIIQVR